MNTAQPEKMKLHPRIIAGINGTPAGVEALGLSLIRGNEFVKNVKK